MPNKIECADHPRDMGLAQGWLCREAIRERVKRAGLSARRSPLPSLNPFTAGVVLGGGTGREIVRHYTHLSERIDGLARSARVPVDSLVRLHLDAAQADSAGVLGDSAAAVAGSELGGEAGSLLARGLPGDTHAGSQWILRRSRPEVGFASVEVTLPWLVSAVAGINEAGLAAAIVLAAAPTEQSRSAPPFLLMVQECLQRFEGIAAATDWCLNRPASGPATLLLADATGDTHAIHAIGQERRVELAPADGVLLAGGSQAVRERIVKDGAVEGSELLGAGATPRADASWVRMEPQQRVLEVIGLGDRADVLRVEA
jgi:hypothetical protein